METIEKVNQMITDGVITRDQASKYFPELAESEEEKIRKALIKLVKKAGEGYENVSEGVSIQKAISWLEKQGEPTVVMRETKPKDISEFLDRLTTVEQEFLWEHIAQIRETVALLEEAQNSSWSEENDDEAWLNDIICKVEFDCILNKDEKNWLKSLKGRVQPQSRQEWSIEDENHREAIIDILVNNTYSGENGKNVYSEEIDWLKSLKGGVQLQSKQEWSEEDNETLNRIISNYQYFCKELFLKDGLTEVEKEVINNVDKEDIDWLKSLRPQKQDVMSEDEFRHIVGYLVQDIVANEHMSVAEMQPTNFFVEKYYNKLRPQSQWKPSDEQMRVLDLAIRCGINRGTTEETTLVSLFNDLKKLK